GDVRTTRTSDIATEWPREQRRSWTRRQRTIDEDPAHAIGLLVHDQQAPRGVLAERLRLGQLGPLLDVDAPPWAALIPLVDDEAAEVRRERVGREEPQTEAQVEEPPIAFSSAGIVVRGLLVDVDSLIANLREGVKERVRN